MLQRPSVSQEWASFAPSGITSRIIASERLYIDVRKRPQDWMRFIRLLTAVFKDSVSSVLVYSVALQVWIPARTGVWAHFVPVVTIIDHHSLSIKLILFEHVLASVCWPTGEQEQRKNKDGRQKTKQTSGWPGLPPATRITRTLKGQRKWNEKSNPSPNNEYRTWKFPPFTPSEQE